MSSAILKDGDTVLCLDPGEHTGWVVAQWNAFNVWRGNEFVRKEHKVTLRGGTAHKDHKAVAELFHEWQPDIVVMERFNLYPGMAKSLSWNSFYPCEVIGVIRYLCECREPLSSIKLVEQAPSIKKYAGGLGQDWVELRTLYKSIGKIDEITEHTKDAYLHWKYFLRQQGQA